MEKEYLLEVVDFGVWFTMYDSKWNQKEMKVLRDVTFRVAKGEVVAIVGASGSGKSILAHGILGILPSNTKTTGEMKYNGKKVEPNDMEGIRGKKIALVPQSVNYLDPLMAVGKQVVETEPKKERKHILHRLFGKYDLCEDAKTLYPFQYSGGMTRKALLATCDRKEVECVIADEPTPGMDLPMAIRALSYLKEMAEEGKAVVLITHDMDLAIQIADRIAVFYDGTCVEMVEAKAFLEEESMLQHPYTKALYQALPQNGFVVEPPPKIEASRETSQCVYRNKCKEYSDLCSGKIPMIMGKTAEDMRMVRCVHGT